MSSRSRPSLLGVVYVVIGLIDACAHHYFAHIHNIKEVAELVLARFSYGRWSCSG